MEQRIGSSSPPVPSAGVDPAYIPGLTPPPAAEAPSADAQPEADISPEEAETEVVATPEAELELKLETEAEAEPEADSGAEAEAEAAEDADDENDDDEDDDPLFEATDRRGAIIADRTGIIFRLDDQEAEFSWDEIGAVEIDNPRFGRRFSVTVYVSARRWFQSDVEAPTRAILKEWAYDLDKVLDAHFEEGTAEDDEDPELDATDEDFEPEDTAEADPEADIPDADPEAEDTAEAEPEAEAEPDPEAEPEPAKTTKAAAKAAAKAKS